jgi:hypothetical protein
VLPLPPTRERERFDFYALRAFALSPASQPIHVTTREEIETRRKSFIRKWRLKRRAVAESLEEARDRRNSALCYLERRSRQILLK